MNGFSILTPHWDLYLNWGKRGCDEKLFKGPFHHVSTSLDGKFHLLRGTYGYIDKKKEKKRKMSCPCLMYQLGLLVVLMVLL